MTTTRPAPPTVPPAEWRLARRAADRRRRIRTAVRAAFWSAFAAIVGVGIGSIEEQRDGWWLMYGAAVVLLVATAVVVALAPRGGRR